MFRLERLRVRTLLIMACGSGLLALAGVSSYATYQVRDVGNDFDYTVNRTLDRVQKLDLMKFSVARVGRAAMVMALTNDPEGDVRQREIIATYRKHFDDSWTSVQETLDGKPEVLELKAAIEATIGPARQATNGFIERYDAGQAEEATRILTEQLIPNHQAKFDAIEALSVAETEAAVVEVKDELADIQAIMWTIAIFALAGVAFCMFLAIRVEGILQGQLGGEPATVRDIVGRLSRGDLAVRIPVRDRDQSSVMAATAAMRDSLQRFSAAQQEMIGKHDIGQTGFRIQSESFEGDFQKLARGVNDLASVHIATSDHLVEVIGEYAVGDFRRDVDRMPGEKARITEAMDTVKRNLVGMKTDVLRLATAAAQGDFSARGDAAAFQHAFKEMVDALNSLMTNAERGLSDVGQVLSAIAKGDLTQCMARDHEGAFARLRDDVESTVTNLGAIVREIQASAVTIDTAATEIASGNRDLSQRSEQQAASLEETAASLEELTSTVRQNAENSSEATRLAKSASLVATEGGEVMGQVIRTMDDITKSSRQISEIIGVIDGIAFQTNILALNAAVEAARAGEQGRGFAVVAAEIRALAQRCANAAREIKQLIETSGGKIDEGAQFVAKAGQTMDEIVAAIGRVGNILEEITAASSEQSLGIAQVSTTVTQIDQNTQQNVALVEEATAVAHSLQDQAAGLTRSVSVFKLA
jgi:methyl-accepting chemotaxis protein